MWARVPARTLGQGLAQARVGRVGGGMGGGVGWEAIKGPARERNLTKIKILKIGMGSSG